MSPQPAAKEERRSMAQRMKLSLRRSLPERGALAAHPLLRPVARHLLSPRLWHLQHEAVARAVAIGLFWAFAMPLGQIPLAAAHCIWWRANVPIAVATTFITNPLTLAFWLWMAYEAGTLLIDAPPLVMPGEGTSISAWLQAVGGPVVLGMAMFAIGGSVAAYTVIKLGWRLRLVLKRGRRARAKTGQSDND